ncbi:ER-golgi trafficking TRAPP I complex 85 kDa subunit-domain-containing protein [Coemansia spiralis]|nr:ER-golgi trafficking TRAPP I complex 85 kDa subunit-domain-containing protein [Coemansia spiralis]
MSLHRVSVTIQDGQGAPYFLDKINIKFTDEFSLGKQHALEATEINELLQRSVAGHSDHIQDLSFVSGAGVGNEAVAAEDISSWAPWYTLFRQQWVNETKASEHESFLHPVACLLVVSGSEADPVASFHELQRHPVVHRVQTQSFSATNVLFYYMLVHDERDTAVLQTIDTKFDQVRRAFGQNTSMLRLNSNTDLLGTGSSDRAKVSGVWTNHYSATHPWAPPLEKSFGTIMTMRDVTALRDSVKNFMVKSVIPHMQYLIRVLSEQTANQRRGITGRLFSAGRRYFGSSTKTNSTLKGIGSDLYFRYDSPEAMMRKLADYSFMLKDYRFAQSVYQVARRDFQSEKAWKCYAGAQEMVGLSKLMLEIHATKAEFESNFEDAISMYLHKTHAPQHFLAVRCIILYYELLKHHKLYSFAPAALLRVPESTASLFALMNEQAAYAYLKHSPRPEIRRFSFYAMISAQAYQGAGMPDLAYRCLRAVHLTLGASFSAMKQDTRGYVATAEEKPALVETPDDKLADSSAKTDSSTATGSENNIAMYSSWAAIDSYINHELGRQCMVAQRYDEAFMYFMALMGDDKVPPKLQAKYLQELLQLFLESCEKAAEDKDSSENDSQFLSPVELSIPVIDPHLARIIMSPELEGEDGLFIWKNDGSSPSQSDTTSSGSMADRCCSVGEVAAVLLVMSNPLTIGVTLNNFTLDCRFDPIDGDSQDESGAPKYEVSTVPSVILEGGQTTMVTVQIVPHCAGSISILGARYLLCDILPTFKQLRLPGRRLNNTKEQQLKSTYAPESTLGFRVDPTLPRLEMTLEEFPESLMSGSMCQVSLRIENRGQIACKSAALWISHPSFFDIKSPHLMAEDVDVDAVESMYAYKDTIADVETVQVSNVLQNSSTFILVGQAYGNSPAELAKDRNLQHLVPIEQLEPGSTCVVPLWLRGDRVGAHTLNMCVGASTDAALLNMRPPRTTNNAKSTTNDLCRMRSRMFEIDLLVTPSLRVNAFVRPSTKNPHERILGIDVENVHPDLHVELVQATFSSGYYRLTPLATTQSLKPGSGDVKEGIKVRLGPRQTISLVYRALPYKTSANGYTTPLDLSALPELFTVNALRQYIYSSEKPSQLPDSIDLVYSNQILGDRSVGCIHSSLQGFIVRAQATRRRNMLRANYSLIPESYFSFLFPLFETFGIDFVLFWSEIGGSHRSGHHSITGIDLGVPHDYVNEALNPPSEGVTRTWLANTAQERETLISSIANRPSAIGRYERPLDVVMKVEKTEHCTKSTEPGSPLYIIDVAISVYNHSWRYAYSLTLDLLSPKDLDLGSLEDVNLDNTGSRAAWTWIGQTSYSMSVAQHGMVTVNANLSCLASGVIDIGLWHLIAKAATGEETTEIPFSLAYSYDTSRNMQFRSKSQECNLYPHQPCFVAVGNDDKESEAV